MRDLTDQCHANWIIAYQNMEKEWVIQALCGEGGYCMVSMVECGSVLICWLMVSNEREREMGI